MCAYFVICRLTNLVFPVILASKIYLLGAFHAMSDTTTTATKATPRRWTLAAIKAKNADGGGFFFTRQTMKFFGDTMRSFGVHHVGDKVYIVRLRPMRDNNGRNMGGIGERRLFDPVTGAIGVPLPPKDESE
jgi:hypothetical protein